MELYHLKTFVTVAEEGHLTRAAERLFTSQPAISAHIKALEEELGITLFHRTPKGMQLTTEGEQLLPRAQETLASAGDFLQFAKGMQDELVGSVRIGLNTDAEFLRLPALQRRLSERNPRLELQFLSGMTGTNIPNVRVGRLDAAFIAGHCADPQIQVIPLTEITLKLAAPTAWRERINSTSLESIAELPWLYTSPDCAYFGAMMSLFKERGCEPAKTVVSDDEEALRTLIRAEVGVGILREDEVARAEKEGYAYALPLELPPVSLDFIYLKKRASDPIIRALLNELAEIWELDRSTGEAQEAV
ncbi:MAG: LysR family transcriptional regulator [Gammaproteobacteria bacterium]